VRSGNYYVVYIATADLLKLAERDEAVRKAIALYLVEKAKNGTPKQREIAEKILKRQPLFKPGTPLKPSQRIKPPPEICIMIPQKKMVDRPGFEFPGATLPGSPARQAGILPLDYRPALRVSAGF